MSKYSLFIISYSLLLFAFGSATAADWFRQNTISPDGSTVAFSYKGDIYTVAAAGGTAKRITTSEAYDGYPAWSPSGRQIAFSSDRCGSLDVFVVAAEGGSPKRLTTNSREEKVLAFASEETVLYASAGLASTDFIGFPTGYTRTYSVDTAAGRPRLFSSLQMDGPALLDGRLLYHDKKGYENEWRKHQDSPVTRDIWLTQVAENDAERSFKQLTQNTTEDRNPVWTQDGQGYYFLSEADGTMNVWLCETFESTPRQITHYTKHPVRYLSASREGTLCYSWDGELYTLKEGGTPVKLSISILSDESDSYRRPRILMQGATDITIANNVREIVFALGGDIYATTPDYKTTRRLTRTPQAEASPSLSPDGRTLVYASDRTGQWQIYLQRLTDDEDLFTYARQTNEELLLSGSEPYTSPCFSPDGKKLAYLANTCEIRVYDFEREAWTTALPAEYNFSYNDGDVDFEWSPDSRWLVSTSIANDGYFRPDIIVFAADGSERHYITQTGYNDLRPQWALGGKAIVWGSDRAGYRSHGSWGSEGDVYIAYLDADAYREALLNKEAREVYAPFNAKNSGTEKGDTAAQRLKLDFSNIDDRTLRLTPSSSALRLFYLAPDGSKLYYMTGSEESKSNLYVRDLLKQQTTLLAQNVEGGTYRADSAGQNLYVCAMKEGRISKIALSDGRVTPIEFAAETDATDEAKRAYIYDHSVAQINTRFCDEAMHGVDFLSYADHYREFLPSVATLRDLSELISELLGELNCSHTGMVYRARSSNTATGCLGAFYDEDYQGDGLKIKEIIQGGPLQLASGRITQGCIVRKIDGEEILSGKDYYPLLAGKTTGWTLLTITDTEGEDFEVYVQPVDYERLTPLLYKRWWRSREDYTTQYSKGRVGYVHVEDMDSKSYRHVYSTILGRLRSCEALVLDERHNGGGWLHDDLALLLSGNRYATFSARGRDIGIEPFTRWTKPSCVLINEDCYSNAHGFPVTYRAFGTGKLVGTAVAGTMTAVWWERLMDGELSLGIPQLHVLDLNHRPLENQTLEPDIKVYNTPEQLIAGDDAQLRRAIDLMLEGE